MPKRKIAGEVIDPTLPKTPITIDGNAYSLCFDLGALAESEAAINAEGNSVNLLAALPVLNLTNLRVLFGAAVRTFHPDIKYADAVKMVTLANVFGIANTIAEAWAAALPESEPVPTKAVAE